MNVLLLAPEYPPDGGGVAASARRIAEGLAAAGDCVMVVTRVLIPSPPHTGEVSCDRLRDGLSIVRFPLGALRLEHWARELGRLDERMNGFVPHVVHAMGSIRFGQLALVLGRRFGAPVVYGMRGSDVNVESLREPGRFASLVRRATAVTAVSKELAERARTRSAAVDAVTVIPNAVAVEPARARECLRAASGFSPETPVLGACLGRRWVKGAERLASIARHVSRRCHSRLALCVFGVDDDGGLAAAWCSTDGDRERVFRSLGPLDRAAMLDAVSMLDLLLLTSSYEGMPNLLLEALAVGTPVAATPAGGCREVIEGSAAGVILPWDEADAADAIVRLIESGALPAMRDRARRHVETHYAPERELEALRALYRSLAGS